MEVNVGPNKIDFLQLQKLHLDNLNPRLPSSFLKEPKEEREIINWLLSDASIIELMLAIGHVGFFVGEALLVVDDGFGEYVVVEGNRRLASLKLLSNPELADMHIRKIEAVMAEVTHIPQEIPCIVFPKREDVLNYLGYRHVTGIKSWSLAAKARYLNNLRKGNPSLKLTDMECRDLAKLIGSRSDYVRNLIVSFFVYEQIVEEGFYKIKGLDESTFYFNYLKDSLAREHIRSFMGVDLSSELPLKNLNMENLKELIHWFFEKNDKNKTLLIGDSNSLTNLNQILQSKNALEYFRSTGDIEGAINISGVSSDNFTNSVLSALTKMKLSQGMLHRIKHHNENDLDVIREIYDICVVLKDAIKSKQVEKDEW